MIVYFHGVNSFDASVIDFFNRFAGRWPRLDQFVVLISGLSLVKGGVIVALLWWAWFSRRPGARETVFCSLIGVFVALGVTRGLAHMLPFRVRPIVNPALHFLPPVGMQREVLINWSAFPSDHAAVFGGLAAGLWIVSRWVGAVAFAYTVVVILLPRLYIGAHSPTDLIAGGLIGVAFVTLSHSAAVRDRIVPKLLEQERRSTAVFYAVLFVVTFEMAELFDGLRIGLHWLRRRLLHSA